MNTDNRWQGKKKAVTFSVDDGAVQDRRVVEILNRYELKGTFHLNSSHLGLPFTETFQGITVDRARISPKEVRTLYYGHEVAAHTLTHPNLPELSDDAVIWQVEKDREILSDLCGYEVVGLAYPNGRYTDKTKSWSVSIQGFGMPELLHLQGISYGRRMYTKLRPRFTIICTTWMGLQPVFRDFWNQMYRNHRCSAFSAIPMKWISGIR